MSPSHSSPSSDSEYANEDSFATYLEDLAEADLETETEDERDVGKSASPYAHKTRLDVRSKTQFTSLVHLHESREDLEKLYPKSLWHKNFTNKKYESEAAALKEIPVRTRDGKRISCKGDSFTEIPLSNFSIYNAYSSPQFPGMFESLHTVSNECKGKGISMFCIDGCIDHGTGTSFISSMVIRNVSIGGLDDIQCHTARQQIWIQTEACVYRDNCWYHLIHPAPEYDKFWEDFLWLADLTKHCIDFLCSKREQLVHLADFETEFNEFIMTNHGKQSCFKEWKAKCNDISDFRRVIIRHGQFLYNQAYNICPADAGLLEHQDLLAHPLWSEIGYGDTLGQCVTMSENAPTTLTPRVAQIFLQLYPDWAPDHYGTVQAIEPCHDVAKQRETRRRSLGFPDKFAGLDNCLDVSTIQQQTIYCDKETTFDIKNTFRKIVLVRNGASQRRRDRSRTKSALSFKYSFGLVLETTKNQKSVRVAWLVTPGESICKGRRSNAVYPIVNELFLTDRCNCDTVKLSDIVNIFQASLFVPSAGRSLLVRSRFVEADHSLVDACEAELTTVCRYPGCNRSTRFTGPRAANVPGSVALSEASESKAPVLDNFSLFSGCGLFDSGLEDYGTIRTVQSVDCNENAILSIRANDAAKMQQTTLDSVDNLLMDYLEGKKPYIQTDICTAGCPCQGFSGLNGSKNNAKSRKNCSLLASTLSYIDLFLPWYVAIENVPTMDYSSAACAQAICTLVALGYQVRKVFLRASEFGGCTTRQRLFILAAAPGFDLPTCPQATHGEGPVLKKIVTAKQAVHEIPPVDNDALINVRYPDHIPLVRHKLIFREKDTVNLRGIVQRIAKTPFGSGLLQSYERLNNIQKEWFLAYKRRNPGKTDPKSKIYQRIKPNKPFPAVTTYIVSTDARHTGQSLHYEQGRTITLEEIRRAQGLPDSFILVGRQEDQHKQVGNGVPWALGSAIGRVVGEAYQRTWDRSNCSSVGTGIIVDTKESSIEEDSLYQEANKKDEDTAEMEHIKQDEKEEDEVIIMGSRTLTRNTSTVSKGRMEDPILLFSDDEDVEMT